MIDWLMSVLFLGLLLAWIPSLWQVSIFQLGVLAISGVTGVRHLTRAIPRPSLDVIALVLLVLWGPLQVLFGRTQYPNETWNASLQWLVLACVYLVSKTVLSDRLVRHHAISIQIWAGTLLAVGSVLLYFASPHHVFGIFESRYKCYGPFIYKNQFGAFLELLLPLAFYRMIVDTRRRIAYAVVFAALFACMAASLSRGGMVIAIGETLAMAALCWRGGLVSGRTLIKAGLPLAALVTVFTLVVGADAIWSRFREGNPYAVRAQIARSTVEMVEARPLTGFGLGTWRTVYPQFATFDLAVIANEAHNDWLQWAADGGIPFALIMLVFVVWVSRFAWTNLWGLGVPALFAHCLVDYPTREPALAALLFFFAGALAAAGTKTAEHATDSAEWRVLSVSTE